jgi:hypothetical protein
MGRTPSVSFTKIPGGRRQQRLADAFVDRVVVALKRTAYARNAVVAVVLVTARDAVGHVAGSVVNAVV